MLDVLVGRTKELAELRSAIEGARTGIGSLVLIAGDPGIGKTRLAEAAVGYAVDAGADVLRATCWEGPTTAFWPWTQLLRDRVSEHAPDDVRRLVGDPLDLETGSPAGESEIKRLALFDAVTRFIRASAAERTLVIVIDDLHWADVPSLRLLEFLVREVRSASVAVISTFRDVELGSDTEVGAALRRLSGAAGVIRLNGLDVGEVAQLLVSVDDDVSPQIAGVVHERTGGNPLFVREFARLLALRGTTADVTSVPVPEGIISVLERRLARLSQRCNELLAMASVIGQEFPLDVVAGAMDISLEDALGLVDEAISSRLLVAATAVGRYSFAHALVRDAVYGGVPLVRRSRLHAAAADVLASNDDAAPEALAHHHLLAATPEHARAAVGFALVAGRAAIDRLAHEDAVEHFRRALDALELAGDDDRRTEVLLELGDARLRAGDMPGARTTFQDVAADARRRNRPDDLARAALGLGAGLTGFEIQMADEDQIALLEEALARLDPGDSPLRARVLARLSVALSYRATIERRTQLASDAVDMARRLGDESVLASALAPFCDAIAGPADSERRIAAATEIVDIALRTHDRPTELLGRRLLVLAYLETGDLASASAQMDAFAWTADKLRQPLYAWYVDLWKGMRAQVGGRLDEALAYADRAEATGARAHSINAPMLAVVLRWSTGLVAERYDDVQEYFERLAELTSYVAEYADFFEGTLLTLRGDVDTARPRVQRFAREGMPALTLDAEWLPGAALFSEALCRVGEPRDAETLYELLLPFRDRFAIEGIGAGTYGSVELHLGLLARASGRPVEAELHFARAIDANARLGAPLLVARAQRELASSLRARGDEAGADDLATRAEAVRASLLDARVRPLASLSDAPPPTAAFVREGELWTLTFDGTTARVKDVKGLRDIATLLARPGAEIAALDLVVERGDTRTAVRAEGLAAPGHAGELLDEKAKASYKARLAELETEIEDADAMSDPVRSERAREERDALIKELASAYGLGGRPRRASDPAERARTTATRRIREAIARISDVHPVLGRHLQNSVRTGSYCSYTPEQPVDWQL